MRRLDRPRLHRQQQECQPPKHKTKCKPGVYFVCSYRIASTVAGHLLLLYQVSIVLIGGHSLFPTVWVYCLLEIRKEPPTSNIRPPGARKIKRFAICRSSCRFTPRCMYPPSSFWQRQSDALLRLPRRLEQFPVKLEWCPVAPT